MEYPERPNLIRGFFETLKHAYLDPTVYSTLNDCIQIVFQSISSCCHVDQGRSMSETENLRVKIMDSVAELGRNDLTAFGLEDDITKNIENRTFES
jgi:hypothetical protein